MSAPGGGASPGIILPQFEIARTGLWRGKTAKIIPILGRRTSWTNTTSLHDIVEFAPSSVLIPEMTGAEALEVVSTSASDTLAGAGAQKVAITYIDALNGNVQAVTPDISMNGLTPVPLGAGVRATAIQYAETVQVGLNQVSTGTISVRLVGAPATVYEQITAGGNRSLSGRFMIPAGMTGYLFEWHVAATNQDQDTRLRVTARESGFLGTTYEFRSIFYIPLDQQMTRPLNFLPVPSLAKLKVSSIATATTQNPRVGVTVMLALIAN